jgi:hypothetical protein
VNAVVLLAIAASVTFVAAIVLAAAAVVPFWHSLPLVAGAGSFSGLAVFVRRPTAIRLLFGLVVALAVAGAAYLGMALATLSWWEA